MGFPVIPAGCWLPGLECHIDTSSKHEVIVIEPGGRCGGMGGSGLRRAAGSGHSPGYGTWRSDGQLNAEAEAEAKAHGCW